MYRCTICFYECEFPISQTVSKWRRPNSLGSPVTQLHRVPIIVAISRTDIGERLHELWIYSARTMAASTAIYEGVATGISTDIRRTLWYILLYSGSHPRSSSQLTPGEGYDKRRRDSGVSVGHHTGLGQQWKGEVARFSPAWL